MVTDMEVEKNVPSQPENLQEDLQGEDVAEAVETENKEVFYSETTVVEKELSQVKNDDLPTPNVSDTNAVEMTVEDSTVKDNCENKQEDLQAEDVAEAVETENKEVFNSETTVVEKELSQVKNDDEPAPNVSDTIAVEMTVKDSTVMDNCDDVTAATGTTESSVDANGGDICGRTGEDDKKCPDLENHHIFVATNDSFLEVKGKDEKDEELTNGVTGMELSNGVLVAPSPQGSGKEELNNEEAQKDLVVNGEIKMDTSIVTVSGLDILQENETKEVELSNKVTGMDMIVDNEAKGELLNPELNVSPEACFKTPKNSFLGPDPVLGDETGTEEERAEFMKELETFHKEKFLDFKPPRFYGEPLNCLKLWRSVIKLGGYEQVTSCKLWRQVGESFNPPKTCTTVSWTFRCFYEKALLEYERHKMRCGELPFTDASFPESPGAGNQAGQNHTAGPGRARRDAASRAMQGWHSHRLGNGEAGDLSIKDKSSSSESKREKQLKSIGLLKRKTPPPMDLSAKVARMKTSKEQLDIMVVDIGDPAEWVKINVQRTKDCFEIYALVPGLLREEVRVQSDPAGHLIISGEPAHIDNPWGVAPFKKIVSLPSRIDIQQTSALVTLHGQLFVRVPFEQSDE